MTHEPTSSSRARGGLLALGVLVAGAAAGALAEEVVYRRLLARRGDDEDRPSVPVGGEVVEVRGFDDTLLHARAFGPAGAPAIVFLHGLTLAHEVWSYQLRELASEGRFRVVAYDARGHGRSGPARGPKGTTPFNAETLARDLWSVLDQTEATPAVVVGHSMGGMTVQSLIAFGEEFPRELGAVVRGLVLLNTTFTASLGLWRHRPRLQATRKLALAAWEHLARQPRRIDMLRLPATDMSLLATRMGFGRRPSPEHVAFTVGLMNRTPSETLAAAIGGLAEFESVDNLEAIDVPTLIVAGSVDVITPVWLAREMTARIPDARLVVFPGAGHMGMLERPDEFNDLIRTFAERVLDEGT